MNNPTKPKDLVGKLLEDDLVGGDPGTSVGFGEDIVEADRIYQLALADHEDWWSAYYHGEVNPDTFSDELLVKILDHYKVEPGSKLADLIYEQIYAGLT